MSEDQNPEIIENITVGIGPRGVMIRVTEGEVTATTYLDIDQAYAHAGHVNAAAITLEQSAYVQQMQRQQEAARMLQTLKGTPPQGGGKVWTP